VQVARGGAGRAAPAFAASSAASLPGILRCPGTQRTRSTPESVCGRRRRSGHCRATS
jgi:hypothetical protein